MTDFPVAADGALTSDEVCRVVGARVREFRLGLGMTMERFANSAGLSIGMLSKIEHGQTSPSLASLTAVANAAGVPFTALFLGLDEEHDAIVVRAGAGQPIDHEGGSEGRSYHDLGALRGPLREIEPVLVTITDRNQVFPLFQHAGVEFLHVLEGTVEYGYGAKRYVLEEGDTMQIHGEVAHGPTSVIDVPVRFLSIKVRPVPDA